VLAFNPKIESIIVMDEKEGFNYEFKIESQTKLAPEIELYKIKNGKEQSYDYLIVAKDNHNLQISVGVDENNILV
jgi:hypothetical protein